MMKQPSVTSLGTVLEECKCGPSPVPILSTTVVKLLMDNCLIKPTTLSFKLLIFVHFQLRFIHNPGFSWQYQYIQCTIVNVRYMSNSTFFLAKPMAYFVHDLSRGLKFDLNVTKHN